jgi:two-component system nitrogen regulation sensor histidine kinase NtrY
MALSFRGRILGILVLLGALPTTALIVGWAITLQATSPTGSTALALERIGTAGRLVIESVDTTVYSPDDRRAFAAEVEELNQALGEAQRSLVYMGYYSAGLAIAIMIVGAILVYASMILAGHLSRQLSRPINELVGWTDRIRKSLPLPEGPPTRGAPEFAALRSSLRDMADELAAGRNRELEAERLRAFQEVARRVAHEMKNPLTPIRFAIAQLRRTGGADQAESLEVLEAETAQLEQLAKEFTDFGRLPIGPAAQVDVSELLSELARSVVPDSMTVDLALESADVSIIGHYDPLRRALGNVLRNAVEATGGTGHVAISVHGSNGITTVRVSDDGPGIPTPERARVFDPYVTGKTEGTGLGLALVKQAVEQHSGDIRIEETPGGGATFVITLQGFQPVSEH